MPLRSFTHASSSLHVYLTAQHNMGQYTACQSMSKSTPTSDRLMVEAHKPRYNLGRGEAAAALEAAAAPDSVACMHACPPSLAVSAHQLCRMLRSAYAVLLLSAGGEGMVSASNMSPGTRRTRSSRPLWELLQNCKSKQRVKHSQVVGRQTTTRTIHMQCVRLPGTLCKPENQQTLEAPD